VLPGEEAAQGGEDRPVSPPVAGAATDLALEDAHLVTQHDQLDGLVGSTTPGRDEERQHTAQAQVDGGEHDL